MYITYQMTLHCTLHTSIKYATYYTYSIDSALNSQIKTVIRVIFPQLNSTYTLAQLLSNFRNYYLLMHTMEAPQYQEFTLYRYQKHSSIITMVATNMVINCTIKFIVVMVLS